MRYVCLSGFLCSNFSLLHANLPCHIVDVKRKIRGAKPGKGQTPLEEPNCL
jgi:hypothetical protein